MLAPDCAKSAPNQPSMLRARVREGHGRVILFLLLLGTTNVLLTQRRNVMSPPELSHPRICLTIAARY